MTRPFAAAFLLLLFAVTAQYARAQAAPPQHQHPHEHSVAAASSEPGAVEAAHHAILEQERAAIERGEGFGAAMVADRNGYPGPKHVLDLKAELKLTPEQQAAIEELFAEMHEQALAQGKEALQAEARLDQMFAQGRPDAELREQVDRIASLRARLRWVHLSAHLAARKLLSAEQLETYRHLRPADHAMAPEA
jgi:Spy/CpxP family protein refolding chaperone